VLCNGKADDRILAAHFDKLFAPPGSDVDKLIAQLKSADILVMAYPMHNFGTPAAVKAYLDAVIFKGETFEMGKKLMSGKKALTFFTAGGIYSEEKFSLTYPDWNTLWGCRKPNPKIPLKSPHFSELFSCY
jgi:putative NADPH-quinone reductase